MNAAIHSPVNPNTSPEIQAERRRALRALLRQPLLPAMGDTAVHYLLVRTHSAWLKHWFEAFPGWTLHIDAEAARLRKTPPDQADETRSAVDATSGSSFSRRRYALLCLALAALERSERQTTLGKIAEAVMDLVAADRSLQNAGMVFDITSHDQRRDLVHAVRFLLKYGLLRRVHGDEQEFLNQTGASDALYEINRSILAVMLNVSRSPSALEASQVPAAGAARNISHSTAERGKWIIEDPPCLTEDARNRQIRSRLARSLLDDPVLYFRDLDAEELNYLERQRGFLLRQICDATGLVPEVRREGIALLDNAGDLTDMKFPEEGTDGQVTHLVAAWLAAQLKKEPGAIVTRKSVEQYVSRLIQIHGSKWRKAVREPGAEVGLAEDALGRLQGLRLVRITPEGIVPLPANGRYGQSQSSVQTETT
jgi:uncharacterized protein (TIGR02678 family)